MGSTLRSAIKESEAVIGVRDIIKLAVFEGKLEKLDIRPINDIEVRDLLRNVKNRRGTRVYKNTSVSTHELNGDSVYAMQLFASSEKLSMLITDINPTFSRLGFGSMQASPSLVLKYNKYAAIYLPVIVEVLPKKLFREAVSNLEKRVKDAPTIDYKGSEGDTKIDLTKMLAGAKTILDKNNMLAVIRDGTHRAYLAAIQNTHSTNGNGRTNIILVQNSTGSAHSIPIKISDIVVVREKPKSNEDRYLGLVQREMEYFKGIGVDG
ncbi:MAG: hypothetical protein KGI06_04565 [Candidatus Micrarchaeota archaeon]|nr:hypothetical protein [Candidatus Micrarchaeota archaeon]